MQKAISYVASEAGPLSPSAARAVVLQFLTSGIKALFSALREKRRRRRAERELGIFDDRMLKDIGIDRSEIGRAVRKGRGF